MSDTLVIPSVVTANPAYAETRRIGSGGTWAPIGYWFVGLGALHLAWRIFQHIHAWTSGLDATAPEYNIWMNMFYMNTVGISRASLVYFYFVTKDCKTCVAQRAATGTITARHEEHHVWILWVLLAALCYELFWVASFFGEQDAVWHQIAVRDTAFTPTHIILFYGTFPLMISITVGAFLYARKHLGHSVYHRSKGFPLTWVLMLSAGLLLMTQVTLNEWSHSFWITEEIFSAPLHWPFVTFAYLYGSIFAVWFQTLGRVYELKAQQDVALGEATQPFTMETMK
ncbi:MAG: methane monooxygenase/ammonia monooxygenase subunit C [Acidimicrobiia bacterium]